MHHQRDTDHLQDGVAGAARGVVAWERGARVTVLYLEAPHCLQVMAGLPTALVERTLQQQNGESVSKDNTRGK